MRAPALLMLSAATLAAAPLGAQSLDPHLLSGLAWRNVGPFRAGRISAAAGALGQPGGVYVGTPNGGGWEKKRGGGAWDPGFDSIKSGSSTGAVGVAASGSHQACCGNSRG